jgi:hypothetical protein
MKRDEAQFDKVERYLRGELSEEENLAMEKAIAEDPDLAQELEYQQLELDAMDLILEDKLRSKMESWKQSPTAPPAEDKRWFPFWIWGVLTLGVVALLFWVFPFFDPSQPTPPPVPPVTPPSQVPNTNSGTTQDAPPPIASENKGQTDPIKKAIQIPKINNEANSLAAATYDLPEDLKGALKSPEEETKSPLDPGLLAFSAKDYRNAILAFNKIERSVGADIYLRAQELLGHAYFLNKKYQQAARTFSVLAQNQDYNTLRQDAEWYLILALLPNYSKNRGQIQQLLIPILDPANYHNHQKQAEDLQKALLKLSE